MPRREVESPTHRRVLALLEAHGGETVSFQSLETGLCHWFDVDESGRDRAAVAYTDTGGAWVATGPPIAAPADIAACAIRFAAAAKAAHRRARIFGITTDALNEDWALVHMGEEPVWNPAEWKATKAAKRSLREQLRRARAKQVTVRRIEAEELADPSNPTRQQLDALSAAWLESRRMAPMAFAVHLEPYGAAAQRRVIVAERNGKMVGFLSAVPVYGEGGWFFEDLIRSADAPNGTSELLFDCAMELIAAQDARHATFGLAPLANTPNETLAWIRDRTAWLYQFEGVQRFKAKFAPAAWHPVYLAHPKHERGLLAVVDLLTAFADGSLVGFGLRTLVHRARDVARIAAAMLVPWIVLLAIIDGRWFPAEAARLGWIGVDTALAFGLFALSQRWSPRLARGLAVAAFADVVMGAVQLIAHTHAVPSAAHHWLLLGAALVAPASLGWVLWRAAHSRVHQVASTARRDHGS